MWLPWGRSEYSSENSESDWDGRSLPAEDSPSFTAAHDYFLDSLYGVEVLRALESGGVGTVDLAEAPFHLGDGSVPSLFHPVAQVVLNRF